MHQRQYQSTWVYIEATGSDDAMRMGCSAMARVPRARSRSEFERFKMAGVTTAGYFSAAIGEAHTSLRTVLFQGGGFGLRIRRTRLHGEPEERLLSCVFLRYGPFLFDVSRVGESISCNGERTLGDLQGDRLVLRKLIPRP